MLTPFKSPQLLILLILLIPVSARSVLGQEIKIDQPIPIDSKVRIGQLENGLTYYIRENKKPENRAEMRLILNVGSLQEDDDQLGLAHFVEHMCFNGTENFEKNDLIHYLQSVGVTMGPDINGYTSFDQTGYMLSVPTDSAEILDNGFQIMEDWAHNVTFDPKEVDKERGVVIEEWRLGRGAGQRLLDQYLPVLLKGSRYADRLPIGTKEIVQTASYETITKFYKDWYRPELMAFIIVGDVNADEMEKKIKDHFGKMPVSEKGRERKEYKIPNHEETLLSIVKDAENAYTQVRLVFKYDSKNATTLGDLKESLLHSLFIGMVRARLNELSQKSDPPFINAFTLHANLFSRTKSAYQAFALVKEDGIETGIRTILEEHERIKKHGFIQSELDRQKKVLRSNYESRYKERDKTDSKMFAGQYVAHFSGNKPIPGIENSYEFVKNALPYINLEEVNKLANDWITSTNRVVVVQGIDKPGIVLPTENDILELINGINPADLAPYEEKVISNQLIENLPPAGNIVSSKRLEEPKITELELSNGARVILKSSDFKEDEIIGEAYSIGGYSIYELEDFQTARYASTIIQESGIGKYSKTDLNKALAGKKVRVNPYIRKNQEGIYARSTPEDLETLMQLIHLYFTDPRKDQDAFDSFKAKREAIYKNQMTNPMSYYFDQVTRTITQDHPRAAVMPTSDDFSKIELDRAHEIYSERFADASDFTFFFVGSFNEEKIKPLIEKYIGSLPSLNREEMCIDRGIRASNDMVLKEVFKGKDEKSFITMHFEQETEFNPDEAHQFRALAEYLKMRYFDVLREEMSGVYGVRVNANLYKYPWQNAQMRIVVPCGPENFTDLLEAAIKELEHVQKNGISDDYISKIHQLLLRGKEKNLKSNIHWMQNLIEIYRDGDSLDRVVDPQKRVDLITSETLQKVANKYLDLNNYTVIGLFPEDYKTNLEFPEKK